MIYAFKLNSIIGLMINQRVYVELAMHSSNCFDWSLVLFSGIDFVVLLFIAWNLSDGVTLPFMKLCN
jgi:hypothetical protein